MNAKHTPGPWKTRKGFIPGYIEVYPVRKMEFGQPSEVAEVKDCYGDKEARANARLIAAAPALLEALVYIQSYLQERSDWPSTEPLTGDIDAAIAKATGAAA